MGLALVSEVDVKTIPLPTSDGYINNFDAAPDGKDQCFVCGRSTSIKAAWYIYVLPDGSTIADPNKITPEEFAESERTGGGPRAVGPECYKNFPELKGFALKIDEFKTKLVGSTIT